MTINQQNFEAVKSWQDHFAQRSEQKFKELGGWFFGKSVTAFSSKLEWQKQLKLQCLIVEQNKIMIEELNLLLSQISRLVKDD